MMSRNPQKKPHRIPSIMVGLFALLIVPAFWSFFPNTAAAAYQSVRPYVFRTTFWLQELFRSESKDVVMLWTCDWATIGNVLTGENQLNESSVKKMRTNFHSVESILHEKDQHIDPLLFRGSGKFIAAPGKFGVLYISITGEYYYESWQKKPNAEHVERYSITISGLGDTKETIQLEIVPFHAEVSGNNASDYNGLTRTNTFIGGLEAYQTTRQDFSIVFTNDKDNIIAGNNGSDAILGWKGRDVIFGYAGVDFILGEQDSDTLYGGTDPDIFVLQKDGVKEGVFDTIADFNPSEGDTISFGHVLDISTNWASPDQLLKRIMFETVEGDLHVFLRSSEDTVGFHVLTIEGNENFDPSSANLLELVRTGRII